MYSRMFVACLTLKINVRKVALMCLVDPYPLKYSMITSIISDLSIEQHFWKKPILIPSRLGALPNCVVDSTTLTSDSNRSLC